MAIRRNLRKILRLRLENSSCSVHGHTSRDDDVFTQKVTHTELANTILDTS